MSENSVPEKKPSRILMLLHRWGSFVKFWHTLFALPFALVLLVTGIGTPLLFWFVNALLLGRELTEMVALRHSAHGKTDATAVGGLTRFCLGGVVAALLAIPFVNLLAPVIGAASATHLFHGRPRHAPV